MNYYGGKNLLAKLRARRRRAAKCKRLNLNCERVSICINPCKFLEGAERKNKIEKVAEPAKIKKSTTKKEAPTTTKKVASTKAPKKVSEKKEIPVIAEEKPAVTEKIPAIAEEKPATEKIVTEEPTSEKTATEEIIVTNEETPTEEILEETAKENTSPSEEIAEDDVPTDEPETAEEVVTEPIAEVLSEEIIEEPATDEAPADEAVAEEAPVDESITEEATTEEAAPASEEKTEEPTAEAAQTEAVPEEKPAPKAEEKSKLDPTENADLLSRIATKRARKLIYAPKEAIYEVTGIKIDVDGKKNDKGVKVKDILEAEIKEGLRLGYLDKYDGLKASEIKEEYENDTVWEIAEQEFKKMGLLLDGDKIKVYVFDWTGTGCHHIGYIPEDKTAELIPYLKDMDKYSFDLDGIITGGKSKTVTKDEKTGKITITKGKDGGYGVDLDVTVINRKD